MKLNQDFYNKHVVEVARGLIGKKLIYGNHSGIIIETEAYRGNDDPASHAYRGRTKRSMIMFGPAGYAYVYIIYGMHHCLNIVTEAEGQAGAVLIRGLMLPNICLNGPGKICKYLGIDRNHNGHNMIDSQHFYVTDGIVVENIIETPRIGISKAIDIPWRFLIADF